MRLIIIFQIILITFLSSFAQDKTDSLWLEWNNSSNTYSTRINALKTIIIKDYLYSNPDSAFYFAQLIHDLSESNNYLEGISSALKIQGISFWLKGDHQQAKSYYEKSLAFLIKTNNKEGQADIYINIGVVFTVEGNHAKAINYFHKALRVFDELGETNKAALCLNNIASIYHEQEDYDRALGYYRKGYKIFQKINDKKRLAMSLNNMGELYKEINNLDSAMFLFNKSLEIKEILGEQHGIGLTVINIADIHRVKGDFNLAMLQYNRALKIFKKLDGKKGLAITYSSIGEVYKEKKDYLNAIKYGEKALKLSKEVGVVREIMHTSYELYFNYKKLYKYSLALKMHEAYLEMKDSIQSEKNQKEIIRQEFLRLSLADSIKNADLHKINELKINEQTAIANEHKAINDFQKEKLKENEFRQKVMYGSLACFLMFSLFIYNRFRKSQLQKKVIELQHKKLDVSHKDLTDSINYAKRIQAAVLPPNKLLKKYLKDVFIFYSPKDIVAGDFYWLEANDKYIFFAVADCTGHGVPGALVSVFCNNALNRSVREHGLILPNEILEKCRKILIEEFEKSDDDVTDGMDISLCVLNKNELMFSGANLPLWINRNGEIIEIKGDRQPIGKFNLQNPFTLHKESIIKGDLIYLFSDGFMDQFGGEKGKKYKASNLKKFLLSIEKESIETQNKMLSKEFNRWKGDLEQVDDVCVMGVRV